MTKLLITATVLTITLMWAASVQCLGCNWRGRCYSDGICGDRCVCVKRDSLDLSGYCAVRR